MLRHVLMATCCRPVSWRLSRWRCRASSGGGSLSLPAVLCGFLMPMHVPPLGLPPWAAVPAVSGAWSLGTAVPPATIVPCYSSIFRSVLNVAFSARFGVSLRWPLVPLPRGHCGRDFALCSSACTVVPFPVLGAQSGSVRGCCFSVGGPPSHKCAERRHSFIAMAAFDRPCGVRTCPPGIWCPPVFVAASCWGALRCVAHAGVMCA